MEDCSISARAYLDEGVFEELGGGRAALRILLQTLIQEIVEALRPSRRSAQTRRIRLLDLDQHPGIKVKGQDQRMDKDLGSGSRSRSRQQLNDIRSSHDENRGQLEERKTK